MATKGISTLFYTMLTILMIDALLEMSFITTTVAFLANEANSTFTISSNGAKFQLYGEPAHVLADQGHTSNGAAGTALVLIGFGGLLTFPFLRRVNLSYARYTSTVWLIVACLSVLLTFVALVYTVVITAMHAGQVIDVAVASRLDGAAYPVDSWTPENWFAAILNLDLVDAGNRSLIATKYKVMVGWRWNLIPLFLLGLGVLGLGFGEIRRWKAEVNGMAYRPTGMKMMKGDYQRDQYDQQRKERDLESPSFDEVGGNVATPMLDAHHAQPSQPYQGHYWDIQRKPVPEQSIGVA